MKTWVIALTCTALLEATDFPLNDPTRLAAQNAKLENTSHHSQSALHVTASGKAEPLVVLKDITFHNGTIDVDVSGAPAKGADAFARGFIGIAFRMDNRNAEMIYIRPTNGRSPDQAMRNHSIQYVSPPDWGWQKLREQFPWKYETYADMQAGEWIHMRIVVNGKSAKAYVGGAEQPTLVVQEMFHGDSTGGVALWIDPSTDGYFRNLKISAE
jgi:hypothetical protein